MPQLRKDPIVSRWVIIATERARRSAAFVDPVKNETDAQNCPFCPDSQVSKGHVSSEIYNHSGVRVVKSGTPFFGSTDLKDQDPLLVRNEGLYQTCSSYGSHEVVIETPRHIANMADLPVDQIKHVFETYAERMRHHQKDTGVKCVIAYKNYGVAAGGRSIGHARSQIMAIPILPMRLRDKLNGAKLYHDFHERSLFVDLVRQEQREGERVVLETAHFIAFCPFAARFPFEVWIVPKRPHCDYAQGVKGYEGELAGLMKELLLKYKIGLNDPAYNYVIQSAPYEEGMEESYSWHIELLPRLTRVAGFERGTGFYINPLPPEMTAQFLREVKI
jgi:UDPglucose--hexose-1-phosphate uridylyltransferase